MKIILRTSIQITFRYIHSLCTFPDYPFLIVIIYSFIDVALQDQLSLLHISKPCQ